MRQWTVDAFASEPFKGNPACVVEPLDEWRDAAWMQALAAENNQAETAFLKRTADPSRFALRWFTPAVEVPLCGHATLASGHVLLAELASPGETITFDTQSGPLTVARADGGYAMDFPATTPLRIDPPAGLIEALGATPREVWAAQFLIAVLDDEATVRAHAGYRRHPADLQRGDARPGQCGDRRHRRPRPALRRGRPLLRSRFGHRGGPDYRLAALHPGAVVRRQARPARRAVPPGYPGRGGDVACELRGDRVRLKGSAVTVAESRLRL